MDRILHGGGALRPISGKRNHARMKQAGLKMTPHERLITAVAVLRDVGVFFGGIAALLTALHLLFPAFNFPV
jgi:hypothetical protein